MRMATTISPRNKFTPENKKTTKTTILKKVIKYLQDQAEEHSTTKTYLTPPGVEPQQHQRHRESHQPFASGSGQRHYHPGMGSKAVPAPEGTKRVQYANENLLQSYEVYVPETTNQQADHHKYWIVYIHGGYFRDPKVDATSFRPALNLLSESSPTILEESDSSSATSGQHPEFFSVQHNIAGYASINYRLSPHPNHPQDPDTTPRYEYRDAKWPQHTQDVYAALRHLQSKYNFGSNYILAGHSVGAELAILTALKAKDAQIPPPKCVIGLNGIYDFPEIHRTNPSYEALTVNAMAPEFFKEASPALYPLADFESLGKEGVTSVIVSHAKDDGLVPWNQVEIMKKVLDEASEKGGFKVRLIETRGSHDVAWSGGKELARVIKEGINMVLTN